MTFEGLAQCYVAALPFLDKTVLGDLFWTAALFGGAWLVQHGPALVRRAPVSRYPIYFCSRFQAPWRGRRSRPPLPARPAASPPWSHGRSRPCAPAARSGPSARYRRVFGRAAEVARQKIGQRRPRYDRRRPAGRKFRRARQASAVPARRSRRAAPDRAPRRRHVARRTGRAPAPFPAAPADRHSRPRAPDPLRSASEICSLRTTSVGRAQFGMRPRRR